MLIALPKYPSVKGLDGTIRLDGMDVGLARIRLVYGLMPGIQTHIQRMGECHRGKMPVTATQIQDGRFKLEILIETIFHRPQHRAEIRQVTQMPPEDLDPVWRSFISSSNSLNIASYRMATWSGANCVQYLSGQVLKV